MLGSGNFLHPKCFSYNFKIFIDQDFFLCLDQVFSQRIQRSWYRVIPFAFFNQVVNVFSLFFMIKSCNTHHLCIKKFPDAVAYHIINSLDV